MLSRPCSELSYFTQVILRVTAGNWSETDRIPIKIPPCDTCGVENTYAGTRAFLQFFYTGELIVECVLASAALLAFHASQLCRCCVGCTCKCSCCWSL